MFLKLESKAVGNILSLRKLQDWETYLDYCQKVRKEYSIYPDLLYNLGRRKVLEHFLQMKMIFKTEAFFNRFEQNARQNIGREIRELLWWPRRREQIIPLMYATSLLGWLSYTQVFEHVPALMSIAISLQVLFGIDHLVCKYEHCQQEKNGV
jgi:hypothetical protein